jgi:hypothetical protein
MEERMSSLLTPSHPPLYYNNRTNVSDIAEKEHMKLKLTILYSIRRTHPFEMI